MFPRSMEWPTINRNGPCTDTSSVAMWYRAPGVLHTSCWLRKPSGPQRIMKTSSVGIGVRVAGGVRVRGVVPTGTGPIGVRTYRSLCVSITTLCM